MVSGKNSFHIVYRNVGTGRKERGKLSTNLTLRTSIQALVESLSVRLQLDIEVLDRRLRRIAASGPLRPYASRQARGFIYRHVLETGKPMLVSNPGREQLCQPCDLKDNCEYRAGLACPIEHQGHVVGIFTLTGLTDSQRAMIQNGGQHLLDLISKLSSGLMAERLLDDTDGFTPRGGALPIPLKNRGRALPACRQDPFAEILGSSPALQATIERARRIARGSAPILISGETGVGKELFARAIHRAGPAANGPLIAVNCAAIPEPLLESELFGYEEGAFTGARRGGKAGKFELADGGTLFLDEIGEMPLGLQPKLLRALEHLSVERVGGTAGRSVNIRIITASNRDLAQQVENHQFRADLYYRLRGIPLTIPPLRQRREDIMFLARHFMGKIEWREWPLWRWHHDAIDAMMIYNWPGNVRELKNAIEYIATMEEGEEVAIGSLPDEMQSLKAKTLRCRLEGYERDLLTAALRAEGRSVEGKRLVADSLGVSLPTLYRRLKELGIG